MHWKKQTRTIHKKINKIFVIGGEQLYREGMNHPYCEEILMNCLKLPIQEYDAFFPEVDMNVYELTERYETEDIIYTRYITQIHNAA
jgi:dihydrofolate reductase